MSSGTTQTQARKDSGPFDRRESCCLVELKPTITTEAPITIIINDQTVGVKGRLW